VSLGIVDTQIITNTNLDLGGIDMKTHCPICLQREGESHKMDCQNAAYVRALEASSLERQGVAWVKVHAQQAVRISKLEEEGARLRELLKCVLSDSMVESQLNTTNG
jgi:hypothetical protein